MKKLSFLFFLIFASCKFSSDYVPTRIEGKQLTVDASIPANDSIEQFIQPYKENIDREMNQQLSYSAYDLTKRDGELNTAIGNMMADAVMEMSNPVFNKRTGNNIDIVLLNHGGIRSSISRGPVTMRTAYQVMPFENAVVIAKLKGEHVRQMVHYLIDAGTAHPVAGIELEIGENNSIKKVLIQGEPLQDQKEYYVATNDYLLKGGDNMVFFSNASEVFELDYKIRNLLIDYFKTQDTIAPVRDRRFIKTKQ